MKFLTIDQKLLLFKIVLAYFGGYKNINVTALEIDSVLTILEENADKQLYWTTQQKEIFKSLVCFCKLNLHQNYQILRSKEKILSHTI